MRGLRQTNRGLSVAVAAAMGVFLMASSASATPVPIDGVFLTGGGPTVWDAEALAQTGCRAQADGFTPVDDGQHDGNGDAFDTGLQSLVAGANFRDADGIGELSGQQLKVGPRGMSGLRTKRIERALPGSPTLRTLIRFGNLGNGARERNIVWDSNLGSDGSEEVRGTSSGDTTFTEADRWVVSSDDAVAPNDPPLVFVLWGPGAPRRTKNVIEAPGAGCLTVSFRIRVPPNSARYLLLFTEMHNESNAEALAGAQKYNNVGPNSPLLAGLGPKVRDRIVNWNVG